MELTVQDKALKELKEDRLNTAVTTMAIEQTYGIRYHEFLKELSTPKIK
tara:strand:+ start:321 stop:467 length:147 start_codon:yes stop_codon:yes gene_type:complete